MAREDAHIARFCAEIGAAHAWEITNGGHRRLTVSLGERKAIVIVASTPGCHRAAENAIRDIRHGLGIVGGKRTGERRKRKQRAPDVLPDMPVISVGRDAFYAPLTELAEAMDVPGIPEIPAHATLVFSTEVSAHA